MKTLYVVTFTDTNGQPKAIVPSMPDNLRIGDSVALRLRMTRASNGRHEVLDVEGSFRVQRISYDATRTPLRMLIDVESASKPPTWRSLRKEPSRVILAPTRSPRQPIPSRRLDDYDYQGDILNDILTEPES